MFYDKKKYKSCINIREFINSIKFTQNFQFWKKKDAHIIVKLIYPTRGTFDEMSDFISFLALSKYVTKSLYTSVGYSYECTWYAFGMRMRAKRGSEKVSREKSEIQKLSAELKTFLNHVGLPRSSKSEYPVDSQGFDLSWKPRPERFPISQTKPYTAQISHNLYGSRQWNILLNEGGKLFESFDDFLSAHRRQRFAGQTVTFIRMNTRKKTEVALAPVRGHEREKSV